MGYRFRTPAGTETAVLGAWLRRPGIVLASLTTFVDGVYDTFVPVAEPQVGPDPGSIVESDSSPSRTVGLSITTWLEFACFGP